MISRAVAIVLAALAGGAAEAASFNCAHADLPAEETVCGNAKLGMLDERTAGIYFVILGSGAAQATVDEVTSSQGEFLAERDACGTDVACLVDAYTARMMYLKSVKGDLGL
jgi:uncharacterized protein